MKEIQQTFELNSENYTTPFTPTLVQHDKLTVKDNTILLFLNKTIISLGHTICKKSMTKLDS